MPATVAFDGAQRLADGKGYKVVSGLPHGYPRILEFVIDNPGRVI